MYLKEIGKVDLINFDKEVELAKLIEKGSKMARADLINANLRLVVSIAKNISPGFDLFRFGAGGNQGLMRAVENLTGREVLNFRLMPPGGFDRR